LRARAPEAESFLLILPARASGQIVEQGNHQQLLDARGHYFELYNSQFAGEPEAEQTVAV